MISVITITYNRAGLISAAIKSVLSQTYTNFEYIIIDDGSVDNTEELVRSFNDERINYYKIAHIGSLSKLRNTGLDKSKGEIIAFLDSDDLWHKDYLSTLSNIYKTQNVDHLTADADLLINGKIIKQSQFKVSLNFNNSNEILKQKLKHNTINIYSSCFSFRKTNVSLRFNENMHYGDNDFFLRVIAGHPGCLVQQALVTITKHDDNMSGASGYNTLQVQAYYEEIKTLQGLFKHKKIQLPLFLKACSENYYLLGNNLKIIGLKRKAMYAYARAFMLNLFKIKALAKILSIFILHLFSSSSKQNVKKQG